MANSPEVAKMNGTLRHSEPTISTLLSQRELCKCRERCISRRDHVVEIEASCSAEGSFSEDDQIQRNYCALLKENISFHGIRDSLHAAGFLRCTWIFILVLATFAAFQGCFMIFVEYYSRPVIVSYFIREADNLTLPDVVICPFNRFNRSYFNSLNISDGLAQYLELAFPLVTPLAVPSQFRKYINTHKRMDLLDRELEILLESIGNISFTEFVKKSAIDCSAFFADPPDVCDSSQEIFTSVGKCYRIKGNDQESDGIGHGIRLVIRLPKSLYNPGINQMLNDGIMVKLAERNRGIDHDFAFIPTGVHAVIPISATFYDFKSDPPRYECENLVDDTYSRVWCNEVCFMQRVERKCGCSLAAASQPSTPNICTAKQFFKCYAPELFQNQTKLSQELKRCKKMCKPPCSYWHYEKTVTYANFPSEQARHFVKSETEWSALKNTIILDVFYTTLDYTIIRHVVSMTPSSFIAQLGGQISLWVGGSIISLIQLVIYLSSAFYAYLRRRSRRSDHRKRKCERRQRHISGTSERRVRRVEVVGQRDENDSDHWMNTQIRPMEVI